MEDDVVVVVAAVAVVTLVVAAAVVKIFAENTAILFLHHRYLDIGQRTLLC